MIVSAGYSRTRRHKKSSLDMKLSTIATNRNLFSQARYRIKSIFWAESFATLSRTSTCLRLSLNWRLTIRNRADLYFENSFLPLYFFSGQSLAINCWHSFPGVSEKSRKRNRHSFCIISATCLMRLVRPIPYFPETITFFPPSRASFICSVSFSRPTKRIIPSLLIYSGPGNEQGSRNPSDYSHQMVYRNRQPRFHGRFSVAKSTKAFHTSFFEVTGLISKHRREYRMH